MIYSRSAEYAIRAFVHLAQVPEGKYAMVKNIAEQEDIPAHFLAKILQQLARKGLLRSSKGPTGGFALRVPTPTVSMIYLVAQVKRPTTKDELNAILRGAAAGALKDLVSYTDEELVSSDFKKSPFSSIIDSKLNNANGDLIQLAAWYDNEWGYSCRLADVTEMVLSKLPAKV